MKVTIGKKDKDSAYYETDLENVGVIRILLEPGPVAEEMGILEPTTIAIFSNEGTHELQIRCAPGRLNIHPVASNVVSIGIDYG